ncbi:MAG TPA: 50S ribosomal protein L25 [Firmicutes bacterium]|jgi:large subunit ribosomal protein L25|nr:MAG: hypothetical protein AA931_08215 [Peptococcaceae bacterium 1109]HHT74051.1 50S ribosomal protein L25 [Bacillota bacterium]
MANFQLAVETREARGTALAKEMRRKQLIPAVVYGSGQPAVPIAVERRELEKALAAGSSLIDLNVGDGTKTVIVREVQYEPAKGSILHVDFYEVAMDQKLEIVVPIRVVNEDSRPNDGGVVATLMWEVTVECLPTDIPEAIDVDVQNLEMGSSIAVKDLTLPKGVEVLADPEEVIVKVDAPAAAEQPAEAEEEGEAEAAQEGETAEA